MLWKHVLVERQGCSEPAGPAQGSRQGSPECPAPSRLPRKGQVPSPVDPGCWTLESGFSTRFASSGAAETEGLVLYAWGLSDHRGPGSREVLTPPIWPAGSWAAVQKAAQDHQTLPSKETGLSRRRQDNNCGKQLSWKRVDSFKTSFSSLACLQIGNSWVDCLAILFLLFISLSATGPWSISGGYL